MNVRQRILAIRLMDKSKNHKAFMNELGVSASVKHSGIAEEVNTSKSSDRRNKR